MEDTEAYHRHNGDALCGLIEPHALLASWISSDWLKHKVKLYLHRMRLWLRQLLSKFLHLSFILGGAR